MRKISFKALAKCLLIFISFTALSQDNNDAKSSSFNISGKVIDAKTGESMPYCNVYISRSLNGAYTDDNGRFVIEKILPGTYQLVISFVGYKTQTKSVTISDNNVDGIVIRLVTEVATLETMEVIGERDKEWERMMKKFEYSLLGRIPFANKLEITNPWVVSFDGAKNNFSATAQEPIEIINNTLGFKMKMNLNKFQWENSIFQYDGYFQFELLNPKNIKEKSNWENNQKIAYAGSITHFLKSLVNDTWQSEGYTLQRIQSATDQNFMGVKSNRIGRGALSKYIEIIPKGSNYQILIKKQFSFSYQNEYFEGNPQTSYIVNDPKKSAIFDANGSLQDPSSLIISGYLVQEGISTLLPLDYNQNTQLFEQQTIRNLADFSETFTEYNNSEPLSMFIRTDKESYFSGETIWLRTYLINSISRLPYYSQSNLQTQLIDSKGQILAQHKLKSINGGARDSFILPDSLNAGEYLIRGFLDPIDVNKTVFERPIKISDFKETAEDENTTIIPTISFFPESGNLVDGVATRVAFKSNIINVSGTVFNEKGKEITSFESSHNGMGYFEITPKADKNYYVQLTDDEKQFSLPEASTAGISMRAEFIEDNLELEFNATDEVLGASFNLLIHSYGQLVHLQSIIAEESRILSLPKYGLRNGINHITLFDRDKRPVLERLIYIPAENTSSIQINMNDSLYHVREKAELNIESNIESNDTLYTDLSIAVIDISQTNQPVDIKTYFDLLSPTSIPYPKENGDLLKESLKNHADLYMMIYGWRSFEWDNFLSTDFPNKQVLNGINIAGHVNRRNGKPLVQTNLMLINMNNGAFSNTLTDSIGHFVFKGLDITDTTNLVLKVEPNRKTSTQALVTIDSTQNWDLIPWTDRFNQQIWSISKEIYKDSDDEKTLAYERKLVEDLENYILLNEVVVTTEREEKPDPRKAVLGTGDHTIRTEDIPIESAQNIFDIIDARVPGLKIVSTGMNTNLKYIIIRKPVGFRNIADQAAAILIDNIPIEPSDAGSINPQDIESVEVFTSAKAAAYGARGANGVVAFYTKKGKVSEPKFYDDPLINRFIYKNAYYTPTEFYSPNYDIISMSDKYVDSRATVYWNPDITLTNHKSIDLSFFTTDRPVELLIDVQGITQAGELIHETKIITVSE